MTVEDAIERAMGLSDEIMDLRAALEVAEKSEKAARDWRCFDAIVRSLELSPDFDASYRYGLRFAAQHARDHREVTEGLLEAMIAARPGQRGARETLEAIRRGDRPR